MAYTQKVIAETFKGLAQSADTPISRTLARMTMAGLPRGGGNGDDIRMTILHIFRDNGIKEGHRPGIEDRFLQQWHQKLHSNTTPEDIAICEAYLHFLHTGHWDDFWAHLWDHNGITRSVVPNPLFVVARALRFYPLLDLSPARSTTRARAQGCKDERLRAGQLASWDVVATLQPAHAFLRHCTDCALPRGWGGLGWGGGGQEREGYISWDEECLMPIHSIVTV